MNTLGASRDKSVLIMECGKLCSGEEDTRMGQERMQEDEVVERHYICPQGKERESN